MTKIALTIAGSDSGGGAGIQADLKTFQELGVFGTSALTAVTAQNTMGVRGVYPMDRIALREQLDAIGEDFRVDALKTGMLFNAGLIEETVQAIARYGWKNIIVDPVMIAKGGHSLLQDEAVDALANRLLPAADLVTPNIPEAELLAGLPIRTEKDRLQAAEKILGLGVQAVVLKGGHLEDPESASDLYLDKTGKPFYLVSKRIDTKDTHGTGCTFSAAITARLASGDSAPDAVKDAKAFIQAAISDGLGIGHGHGPTNHWGHRQADGQEVEVRDALYAK